MNESLVNLHKLKSELHIFRDIALVSLTQDENVQSLWTLEVKWETRGVMVISFDRRLRRFCIFHITVSGVEEYVQDSIEKTVSCIEKIVCAKGA